MTPPSNVSAVARPVSTATHAPRIDHHDRSARSKAVIDVGPLAGPTGWCAAEDLRVAERLVIAERWGRFAPDPQAPTTGEAITLGQSIGTVGGSPVCSAFSGTVAGWLAAPGEQVRTAQPLLWLRVAP